MPDFVGLLLDYRYWIIVPLAILEGPLVAFAVGALAAQNLFSLPLVYALFLVKDAIFEGGLFLLGRQGMGSRRVDRWIARRGRFAATAETIRALWAQHGLLTMLVSKLSYGLSAPLLLTAGLAGMRYSRFLLLAVPVSLAQYAVFLGIGYVVGDRLGAFSGTWEWVAIAVAALAVVVLTTLVLSSWLRRRLGIEPVKG